MDGGPICKCMSKTSACSIHPSTPGEWIASQAAFLAKTYQRLEEARVLPASDRDSGASSPASFAWYDPDTHSLKTAQCSLFEDSMSSSVTLPRWGSMRNGRLYQQPIPVRRIGESASGSWPTIRSTDGDRGGRGDLIQAIRGNENSHYKLWPTPVAHDDGKTPEAHMRMKARMKGGPRHVPTSLTVMVKGIERGMWPTPTSSDHKGAATVEAVRQWKTRGRNLPEAALTFPTPTSTDHKGSSRSGQRRGQLTDPAMGAVPTGGKLNPQFSEWLMGWPIGWTALKPSATAKSRNKPRLRGES
jgi:hypothetical protein